MLLCSISVAVLAIFVSLNILRPRLLSQNREFIFVERERDGNYIFINKVDSEVSFRSVFDVLPSLSRLSALFLQLPAAL